MHNTKITGGCLSCALHTNTSAKRRPENVFLNAWDGGAWDRQCQITLFGFWGGAPNTHTSANHGPENVFLDAWDGGFWNGQCQKTSWGSAVAPQTPIPLHTMGQKMCFWIPGMEVFEMDNAQKTLFRFWGGAPNTHTSAHHGPENVFLDTWDGGV